MRDSIRIDITINGSCTKLFGTQTRMLRNDKNKAGTRYVKLLSLNIEHFIIDHYVTKLL